MGYLPLLLGLAVLLPLCSFFVILVAGPKMGKLGVAAGSLATFAIAGSCVLSFIALIFCWLPNHFPQDAHHGHHSDDHAEVAKHEGDQAHTAEHAGAEHAVAEPADTGEHADAAFEAHGDHAEDAAHDSQNQVMPHVTGDWYTLGTFGNLHLTIGYYIDSLTVAMFCMVTLIATCIHFYATGYMHDELTEDFVDHEVTMSDGSHLHRPGRYPRFFQALSLFCFSMLGLVIAGNIAMTFVFWELVGICSYFLIGFYVERHSASTAANKAFIVNRVGDFGMIIGLMALWGSLGTFAYGDIAGQPGIFSQVRPAESGHQLIVPEGMVRAGATNEINQLLASMPDATPLQIEAAIHEKVGDWRDPEASGKKGGHGYWLLIIAGLGIFCGCVGKSAQFPLHVWLPDAMEGPTPVSALVHSATMVAAGVYLVARFYPVFTPEVLLVIAIIGTITLFMAATIAITATDIKRVLAYSTVSQLGYMMMALGVGGWLAGVMHLFTHAFFKSLLFLCSGSVIHGVHTNEMPLMGGLRKKMPVTAYTMLVGCLAIAGAGIPFLIGFSGYYSKDAILEQARSFGMSNPGWANIFFFAAAGGAAITAFYMFRLWYMTFAGEPRDPERYAHAHESPPSMYLPLVVLSVFAVGVAWKGTNAALPTGLQSFVTDGVLGGIVGAIIIGALIAINKARGASAAEDHGHAITHDRHVDDAHEHDHGHGGSNRHWSVVPLALCGLAVLLGLLWIPGRTLTMSNLLEQARPLGTMATESAALVNMTWPSEELSHAKENVFIATLIAFSTALAGIILATVIYGLRLLDPEEARKSFRPVHSFLLNKWWFDELYDWIFVRPTHFVSGLVSGFDRRVIDKIIDGLASLVRVFSVFWEKIADQTIVDGAVNKLAQLTYKLGVTLREVQTGSLRQYVLFIVVGAVAIFALVSFFLGNALAS